MVALQLRSRLRQRRSDAGLSQSELAEHVDVSRQAILAIEAGRQVPSTTLALSLARVLRCSVEDLFSLPASPGFSASLANVPEARPTTRLALGLVDGAWAAHPITRGDQPADALLTGNAPAVGGVTIDPLYSTVELEHNVLVAGCAPLLGVLAGCLGKRFGEARATWLPANSTRALELLADDMVHVAGLHLVDSEAPEGHAALVHQHFPLRTMTIVNLTRWRQGLVVASNNPLGLRTVNDLVRPGVRLACRDAGAGAQQLLERVLAEAGLAVDELSRGPCASGHAEVARLVRLGLADAGVAIEAAALDEGLDFIPLAEERFDLILPETRLAARHVARLVDLIERPAFRADAARLAGYDLSTAGHASTVAAA